MAAYASLVSLAQTIQNFLHYEYDHHQLSTSLVGDLQIESLQEHVNLLQAFLDDSRDDKVMTDLEGRIRDASNAAEDTLEYFMLRSEDLQKLAARSQDVSKRRRMGLRKEEMHQKLASKLNEAAEKIGSIVGEVMNIKNNTTRVEFSDSSSPRLSPSIGKDDIMVGFDDDLLAIKSHLCGDSRRLEIIPICGMGGIGKTTLARNAYEDPSTIHRFHIRAWVTVSQDYKAQEVLSRLQVSMKAFVGERNGEGDEVVYKTLKGQRYLIVLDDMWSTEVWDEVKGLFPDDNNGSRILLTTRLADVAAYADYSSNLHQMCLMDMNWSWQLLQQKVFKKEECPPQLENIGRMIGRSCKGLPLAIVVVAGILSTISPTKASWEEVASKVISTFTTNDDEITKIFSLSYIHLPHYLRPCFLYMGGFPEDYEIHASKLVKLWTAEGFVKSRGSKSFEDVAEEYLEDLIKRSLVLLTRRKPNGKISSCNMHDLLRDLCIRKAEEENFLRHDDEDTVNLEGRRNLKLCRLSRPGDHFGFLNMESHTVRSVLFFHGLQRISCLKRFRLLRVLDVKESNLKKFPDDVLELNLLRYLAFTFNIRYILLDVPSSISKLQNLQTLLIFPQIQYHSRYNRVRFPLEIWSMRHLRHLHVVGIVVPLPKPCPIPFPLQDLRTLATVKDFRCTERVLQMIPNLEKLGIIYDYEARVGGGGLNWQEYYLHNLVHLHHLENLSICVKKSTIGRIALWGELRLPMMLKKLKLEGLQLSKQDLESIGSLPNLEVLKLIRCDFEDSTWETTEGEFPKLKVLKISRTNVKKWMTESSHFPSLKHLHLSDCFGLREIPEEIGEIPTLELIVLDKLSYRSLVESTERIKEEQQSYGNDSFQVQIMDMAIDSEKNSSPPIWHPHMGL